MLRLHVFVVWPVIVFVTVVMLLLFPEDANASECNDGPLNPITDVSWRCIFPIQIAGIVQLGSNSDDADEIDNPVCVCDGGTLPKFGITVSFWEPSRLIDTVSDPYCLMALGANIGNPRPGSLGGTLDRDVSSQRAFQQMHYYIFPVWAILDLFTDIQCLQEEQFDVAMMSELVPTWNDDILSTIVNPESVLFANPVSQLACAADSSAVLSGRPRNELFWCMGSWGSVYPLAGSITVSDYVEANAGLAARSIYFMGRTGLLWDTALDGCSFQYTPIWRKDRFKLQMAKPVRDPGCQRIGRSGLLWSGYKHPSTQKDNFAWMMFKKVNCCVTYEY